MATSRTRHRTTWKGAGSIEVLEERSLLSRIPSAGVFNTFDDLNGVRLANIQALDNLRIQNTAAVQTIVADGQFQTQNILTSLNATKSDLVIALANRDATTAAADRQAIAADTTALVTVRTLMNQAQAIGARVNQILLGREHQLGLLLAQFHTALNRGADPTTVDTNGTAALNNVVTQALNAQPTVANLYQNIDTQIINAFPPPVTFPAFTAKG
jgi:hypothetical protein